MKMTDEERERREKERRQQYFRKYYANNREYFLQKNYKWRRENREKWNAWQRAYYAAHRLEISERRKAARLKRLAPGGC